MFGEVAKLSPLSWKPVPNSSVYQPLHIQYFLISEKTIQSPFTFTTNKMCIISTEESIQGSLLT